MYLLEECFCVRLTLKSVDIECSIGPSMNVLGLIQSAGGLKRTETGPTNHEKTPPADSLEIPAASPGVRLPVFAPSTLPSLQADGLRTRPAPLPCLNLEPGPQCRFCICLHNHVSQFLIINMLTISSDSLESPEIYRGQISSLLFHHDLNRCS